MSGIANQNKDMTHTRPVTRLPASMKSSRIFRQARHWIQDCERHHQSCQKYEASAPLPTRLVAVRRTLKGLSARLCNSQSLTSGAKYITLSHCWGTAKFLTLREDNKDAFQKSIPIRNLTRTFQDALYATMKLGFTYIWIDSLCIIQDSPNLVDWKHEAERMCNVYKNAVCNLAALAAPNGESGLFTRQDREHCFPIGVRVNGSNIPGLASSDVNYAYIQDYAYLQMQASGPLTNRAWVFQEQLLVRRDLAVLRISTMNLLSRARQNVRWSLGQARPSGNVAESWGARCGRTAWLQIGRIPRACILTVASSRSAVRIGIHYIWSGCVS